MNEDKFIVVDSDTLIVNEDVKILNQKDLECLRSQGIRDKIKRVILPEGLLEINKSCFGYFTDLQEINLPNTLIHIGDYAFHSCSNLSSVAIPNKIKNISEGMFALCNKLSHVELPDGIDYIGNCAFQDCVSLKQIELPDSVRAIRRLAFWGCVSLQSLDLPKNIEYVSESAFQTCRNIEYMTIQTNNKPSCTNSVVQYDDSTKRVRVCNLQLGDLARSLSYVSLDFIQRPSYDSFVSMTQDTHAEIAKIVCVPFAVAYGEKDSEYYSYLKSHSREVMIYILQTNDIESLACILENKLIPIDKIDECIMQANRKENGKIFLALIDYKDEIGGYELNGYDDRFEI